MMTNSYSATRHNPCISMDYQLIGQLADRFTKAEEIETITPHHQPGISVSDAVYALSPRIIKTLSLQLKDPLY